MEEKVSYSRDMSETSTHSPDNEQRFSPQRTQIAPVIEEIRTKLTELASTDFQEIVETHLKGQFQTQAQRAGKDLSPHDLDSLVQENRNKVERNVLFSILIHESLTQCLDQIVFNEDMNTVTWKAPNNERSVYQLQGGVVDHDSYINKKCSPYSAERGSYYFRTEQFGRRHFYHLAVDPSNKEFGGEIDERIDVFGLTATFFEEVFRNHLHSFLETLQFQEDHPLQALYQRLSSVLQEDSLNDGNVIPEVDVAINGGFSVATRLFAALSRFIRVQENLRETDRNILLEKILAQYNIPAFLAKQHLNDFIESAGSLFIPHNADLRIVKNALKPTEKRSGTYYSVEEAFSAFQQPDAERVVTTGCPALPTKDIKRLLEMYVKSLQVVYLEDDDDFVRPVLI